MSIESQMSDVKTEHAPSAADLEAARQLIEENPLLKADTLTKHVFDQKGFITQTEGPRKGESFQTDLGNWLQRRLEYLTENPVEARVDQANRVKGVEAEAVLSSEELRDKE